MVDSAAQDQREPDPDDPQAEERADRGAARELVDEYYREKLFAELLKKPVRITWVLLVVLVLLWLGAYVAGSFLDGGVFTRDGIAPDLVMFYTGLKLVAKIDAGEYWRLISNTFTHLSLMHIGFNAYGLYVLGPLVERFFGTRRMIHIYMSAGLLGSLGSYWFSDVPSGGASGAIYGLAGALMAFGWFYRQELPQRVSYALTRRMFPYILFGIGIGFIPSIPFDNAAHIGGLLGGGLVALIFGSRLSKPSVLREGASWLMVVLWLAVVGWMFWAWGQEFSSCTASIDAYLKCYPELRAR